MKQNLVLRPNEFSSFTSWYLESFWNKFFTVSIYDPKSTYDKKNTVFVVWWNNVNDPWCTEMQEQGFKVAVDNLWEPLTYRTDFYWIEHKFSMRWNESLWWRALGYETYRPDKKNLQYLALMQIRRQDNTRDTIVKFLHDYLDMMLWSYMAKNQRLPNDTDDALQGQRYMHSSWYDQTYCSVVVETFQDKILHASEKSYKPIAYYHPYMIISVPGALSRLKDQGFMTFDNLFDESYDEVDDFMARLEIIRSNLSQIHPVEGYDKETMDRCQHNHNLFFDVSLVEKCMIKEIVFPLLEYAET